MTMRLEGLFPTDLPGPEPIQFPAAGFSRTACGVIYRLEDQLTNGMPLGGVDTGCLDVENTGLLGYCTLFNTHVPRRGPINLPFIGLSVGGKTWVLCDPKPKDGEGSAQQSGTGRTYDLWQGESQVKEEKPITPLPMELDLDGVETAEGIHYWGHYPVVDIEFETGAPINVGLRSWSPFLPGDVVGSMLPGAVFEAHLRNPTSEPQRGTIAFTFPGPTDEEAGTSSYRRKEIKGGMEGVEVIGTKASYALVVLDEGARTGNGLGGDGSAWAKIPQDLPQADASSPGTSLAVDFQLDEGGEKVVRFILGWHSPTWNAGGYNWAGADHEFRHMYAKHYGSAAQAVETLARDHESLLRRILDWQQVIYDEETIPVWLRESLVNNLHLITEDGMWAQAEPPIPDWVREEDGLFGMNECPRGCPQIECIPCSFYGNQPLAYFFPQLALSTLRGYKGYQYPDGAAVWIFGGCTGGTPPIDFVNPTRGYQFATNGISLAAMVDRYYLCHGDQEFLREFQPTVKENMVHAINLRTTPSYSIGEKIISMPDPDSDERHTPPTEWFEAAKPGWLGMTAHLGGLRLAQLRIAERMSKEAGDAEFAEKCARWIQESSSTMEEKMWTGSYYLNFLEPDTGRRSDLIFGYQLDGNWIIRHHGLEPALPQARVDTTLDTIKRFNVALSKFGAVNYTSSDGTSAEVGGYGTYSFFPPEALMLAMTYMYNGQGEFGMELARRVWHNIVCQRGYTWDMPNIMRGDADTGERTFGNDYYQDMMLWSMPAAILGQDFGAPVRRGGLVERIIAAARGA
jgi:uncharacterized protein (DUF608 family)